MTGGPDLVLSSRRVVTPTGVRPARVHVRNGAIADVAPVEEPGEAPADVDLGDLALLPGIVDTHVHVNEPGRTEWEGFATAGRAAASGGVTTLIDMPLNSDPVTVTVDALAAKVAAAEADCVVDFGFWGGLVPGNDGQLAPLHEAGVLGFKCFLVDSGLPEFPPVSRHDLETAMPRLCALESPLLVHAELDGPMQAARAQLARRLSDDDSARRSYEAYAASRPEAAEVEAIESMAELAGHAGCHVHVVHVSSRGGVEAIRSARAGGAPLSGETCPHYLTFADTEIPDGATAFKCAPPIRGKRDRDALWSGLAAGTLALVASDHSPCPPELKRLDSGDFFNAWGGISSLDLALSAVWTGARERGFGLDEIARWMAEAPARLAGLDDRKGMVAPGLDADLIVFDPDGVTEVESGARRCRHGLTPYEGRRLAGRVVRVYVRGHLVYDGEAISNVRPGRWLRHRKASPRRMPA